MNIPTPEQIAKLPKWAQEYIENLDRRVLISERALKQYEDSQTPSAFYYEDYLCVGSGSPQYSRKYIQTNRMSVERDGVQVDVLLRIDEPGIEISWSDSARRCKEIAMVPTSFQRMKLITKETMR